MSEKAWLAAPKIDYDFDGIEFRRCGNSMDREVEFIGIRGKIVGVSRDTQYYLVDTGEFDGVVVVTRHNLQGQAGVT